jgi:DMSO reductase anchor subunit/ferredoxin
LNGCPVLAYDKDPITGIVRHLDDQCIGCQYCVFKCPYDVPKYSASRGIVRKCDMCAGRLAVGEAPACVQACPHEAIRITVVEQEAVRGEYRTNGTNGTHGSYEDCNAFLPGAPEPRWTLPTTRYVTKRELSASLVAADVAELKPEHGHTPLVIMLVLTQLAVGGFVVASLLGGASVRWLTAFAFAALVVSLVSSTLHLGRPLKAWRAFLGLRRSWLSREIVVFGLLPSLAATALAGAWLPEVVPGAVTELATISAAIVGLAGVFCSAMIYHDTPRESWHGELSLGRFFATTVVLGLAVGWFASELTGQGGFWLPVLLAVAGVLKLSRELAQVRRCPDDAEQSGLPLTSALARCAYLMKFTLGEVWRARLAAGWIGCVILPLLGSLPSSGKVWFAALSLLLCLSGELLERSLFFKAVASPRMPGGVGA